MLCRANNFWSLLAISTSKLIERFHAYLRCLPSPSNHSNNNISPPSLNFDHTDDVISYRLHSLDLYSAEHHLQVTRRIRDIEQLILAAFLDAFRKILATPQPLTSTTRPTSAYISLLVREFEKLYQHHLGALFNSLSKPSSCAQEPKPTKPKPTAPGRRQGRPCVFTKHQTLVLHELLRYDDKLNQPEKILVAGRLGLTKDQVNRWFCNARARRLNKKCLPSSRVQASDSATATVIVQNPSLTLQPSLLDPRLRSAEYNSHSPRDSFFAAVASCPKIPTTNKSKPAAAQHTFTNPITSKSHNHPPQRRVSDCSSSEISFSPSSSHSRSFLLPSVHLDPSKSEIALSENNSPFFQASASPSPAQPPLTSPPYTLSAPNTLDLSTSTLFTSEIPLSSSSPRDPHTSSTPPFPSQVYQFSLLHFFDDANLLLDDSSC